jgi:polyhydroxybutyrate depolymerase
MTSTFCAKGFFMRRFCLSLLLIGLLISFVPVFAQESTPEASPEPDATAEAEATIDAEPEATAEPESTAAAESTVEPEATDEPGQDRVQFPGTGSFNVREDFGTQEREFAIDIPASYSDDGDPMPLVFVLHGAGGSGNGIRGFSGFAQLGEELGFISVFPSGLLGGWNDGRPDPGLAGTDDIGYFEHVIRLLTNSLNVDENRIYATGYSMGGMMSYRLGCNLPQYFAAIASVASPMPLYIQAECDAAPALPVLVIQGTDDHVVPWMGIRNAYLSAPQTMAYWADHNGCPYEPAFVVEPDARPEDGTLVIREQYDACDDEVMMYGIYQGGHTWPGRPVMAGFDLGVTSYDINAADVIWAFFERQSLDDAE